MTRTSARRQLRWAAVALALLNAGAATFLVIARTRTALYPAGSHFPEPAGVLAGGTVLRPEPAACRIVRIVAVGCPFCAADSRELASLLKAGRRAGCQEVLVSATPGGSPSSVALRPGAPEVDFVDLGFGAGLNPYLTPQTILIGPRDRVRWACQGSMGRSALARAIRALDSLDPGQRP